MLAESDAVLRKTLLTRHGIGRRPPRARRLRARDGAPHGPSLRILPPARHHGGGGHDGEGGVRAARASDGFDAIAAATARTCDRRVLSVGPRSRRQRAACGARCDGGNAYLVGVCGARVCRVPRAETRDSFDALASCVAAAAELRDLLDAPTALAACCGFDLCHNCILYLYLYFSTGSRSQREHAARLPCGECITECARRRCFCC